MAVQEAIPRRDSKEIEAKLGKVTSDSLRKLDNHKRTALWCAAESGSEELVNELIDKGANPDEESKDPRAGGGPLVAAASSGNFNIVDLLLRRQVHPDRAYNRTPLSYAAEAGHEKIVKRLEEKGANVDSQIRVALGEDGTNVKRTPLSFAAEAGHDKIVRYLYLHYADIDITDHMHRSPLFFAVKSGHKSVVQYLVSKGANLNNTDANERTMFSHVATFASSELIQFLVQNGANWEASDDVGRTPLSYAAESGRTEVIQVLLDEGAERKINKDVSDDVGRTPLSYAAEFGRTEVIQVLLGGEGGAERKMDMNVPDCSGRTPLSYAAGSGCTKAVEAFLERDPQVYLNTADDNKRTPLSYAAQSGHTQVVQALIKRGLNLNLDAPDKDERTPLSYAAQSGHTEVVLALIKSGLNQKQHAPDKDGVNLNLDTRDKHGRTPLSYAAQSGHTKVVLALIQSNLNLNLDAPDKGGRTPLSYAAGSGHAEVIRTLVGKHAKLDTPDCAGRTPLSYAAEFEHTQVVQLLIQEGVNIDARDSEGWTPLEFATKSECDAVVQLLLDHGASFGIDSRDYGGDWGGRRNLIAKAIALGSEALPRLLSRLTIDNAFHGPKGPLWLLWAAWNDDQQLTDVLLEKEKQDVNMRSLYDRTPISFAAEGGHVDMIRLLLSYGADPNNSRDAMSRTPLWWAASRGHTKVVENLLLDDSTRVLAGPVSTGLPDKYGQTALAAASNNGHLATVQLLLDHSDLSIEDNKGRTPLWLAGANRYDKVVQTLVPKDVTTLHCLVRSDVGDLAVATCLLDNGYNVNMVDNEGWSPLHWAVHLRKIDWVTLLLERSAHPRGILTKEWLEAFSRKSSDVLELSPLNSGGEQIRFLGDGSQLSYPDVTRRLLIREDASWIKALFQGPKVSSGPYKLQIEELAAKGRALETWISLEIPSHEYHGNDCFVFQNMGKLLIAWRAAPSRKASEPRRPTLCLSSLQYGWIPEDVMDFFIQFLQSLKELWTEMCKRIHRRFVDSRLDQLRAEGKSSEMMRRLAKDAQRLAILRLHFQDHLQVSRDHIKANGAQSSWTKVALNLLEELEGNINGRLSQLDETLKELLQIEFSWAAITESRISTSLGQNVMLLTYVSILYIPLAYCAALWAIPNITDNPNLNPFIITSVCVALGTLLIALNLEGIASLFRDKYLQCRVKIIKTMKKDKRWETRADELQDSIYTRTSPSEWLIIRFWLSRLFRGLKGKGNPQEKVSQSGIP